MANYMLGRRRMVFATEFWFGSTGAGLASGFRANGWAVQQIDTREFFTVGRTTALRLATRLARASMARAYNDAILTAVQQLRPQAFVTVKGVEINPDAIKIQK